MGWLGKIVGGAIGFAMGGPLGAVLGATFGHAFDQNDENYLSQGERPTLTEDEEGQMTFFVAVFSMLAKLAKADGKVSQAEIDSIEKFMVNELKLGLETRIFAVNIFNSAKTSPQTFQDFAHQFYAKFHHKPQLLEMMIELLIRVSIADGNISREEETLILEAVGIFNFSRNDFNKIKSKYVNDDEKYYSALKCNRNDSDETIRKQYRKLVFEYHPDKIASKGLPDEFTKFATDKFREIQEAYEVIRKERGF